MFDGREAILQTMRIVGSVAMKRPDRIQCMYMEHLTSPEGITCKLKVKLS